MHSNSSWFHNRGKLMLPFSSMLWDLCVLLCGQPPREPLLVSREGTDGFVFARLSWRTGGWHRAQHRRVWASLCAKAKPQLIELFLYFTRTCNSTAADPAPWCTQPKASILCWGTWDPVAVWTAVGDCPFLATRLSVVKYITVLANQ